MNSAQQIIVDKALALEKEAMNLPTDMASMGRFIDLMDKLDELVFIAEEEGWLSEFLKATGKDIK